MDFLFISEQLSKPFDLLEIGSLRIGCLFTLLLDFNEFKTAHTSYGLRVLVRNPI